MLKFTATAIVAFGISACSPDQSSTSDTDYSHLIAFDTARVRIAGARDTAAKATVTVELAESDEQHTMGLMERRALPPDAGMLFIYSAMQPDSSAFWMFRTRIPLDIAFIDSAGVIRTIKTMQPCRTIMADACERYSADAAWRFAMEANAGYFARMQVRVGDRLLLADTLARRVAARTHS